MVQRAISPPEHPRAGHDEQITPLQPGNPFEPSVCLKQWISTASQQDPQPGKGLEPPTRFDSGV